MVQRHRSSYRLDSLCIGFLGSVGDVCGCCPHQLPLPHNDFGPRRGGPEQPQVRSFPGVLMNSMKRVAASAAIAGALGVCALGIGDTVANAAPPGPGVRPGRSSPRRGSRAQDQVVLADHGAAVPAGVDPRLRRLRRSAMAGREAMVGGMTAGALRVSQARWASCSSASNRRKRHHRLARQRRW